MNDMSEAKQQSSKPIKLQENEIQAPLELESQFADEYALYFNDLEGQPSLQIITQRLASHFITYSPFSSHQPFPIISIEKKSKHFQIVILKMKWGRFTQKLSLINFLYSNPFLPTDGKQQLPQKSILYQRIFNHQQFIFKSQSFNSNSRSHVVLTVLKEIFIGKIASALEFGPQCSVGTCFDLFLYDNSIQFGMEKCISSCDKSFKRLNTDSLRLGLRLMHSIGIIHYDIKPDNIMFSQNLNKLVTIDFNLSDITDIKIGTKLPIRFRGTINFCYLDMAQNFILGSMPNHIDPYYNDVHCLKQSISFISGQSIQQRQYNSHAGHEEYFVNKSQEEFVVLCIKSLLFFEEWNKVEQFCARFRTTFQQKSVINISEFLYQLEISEGLQRFYHVCIPKYYKEALSMREFNYMLTKKWTMSITNDVVSDKRKQFEGRLHFADMTGRRTPNETDKKQTCKYLKNETNFTSEPFLYFGIFLNFVSYHHNTFRVNRQQREDIAGACCNFILKHSSEANKEQSNNQQTTSNMETALIFILQSTIKNLALLSKKSNEKDNFHKEQFRNLKDHIWKLLSFIFILDIGFLEERITWFKMIIETVTSIDDKLAILFKIRQLNQWNRHRIQGKGGKSRFYILNKIYQFVNIQFQSTNKRQSNQDHLAKLRQKFYNNCKSKNVQFDISNIWMRQIITVQKMIQEINISLYDYNFLQKLEKSLQVINAYFPQFRGIYLTFYQWYRQYGQNNISIGLYNAFRQNLNDQSIEKQFSIYYYHQFMEKPLFSNIQQWIKIATEYIDKLQPDDIILNQNLMNYVDLMGEFLQERNRQNPKQGYLQFSKIFQLLRLKLIRLVDSYHWNKRNIMSSFSLHLCFSVRDHLNLYLFNINKYINARQYCDFLQELCNMEHYKDCDRCKVAIDSLFVICMQDWILTFLPSNALQMLDQLGVYFNVICERARCDKPQQEHTEFDGIKFHILVNFAIFCSYTNSHEAEEKGMLQKLYQFIKNQKIHSNVSYVWAYFGQRHVHKMLLRTTMFSLFKKAPPQQFMNFLQILSQFLDKNLNKDNFNIVMFSFLIVVRQISRKSQLSFFEMMLARYNESRSQRHHFRVYFYVFAQYLECSQLQKKALYLVAQGLQFISFDFQNYYSSEIHRYFVLSLRKEGNQFTRKENCLNNKLVKLLMRLGRPTFKREKKRLKSTNKPYCQLLQKAKRIQGPFKFDEQLNQFTLQMNIRSKKR